MGGSALNEPFTCIHSCSLLSYVKDEVAHLEKKAQKLNNDMAEADEEQQNEIQMNLEAIYARLDQLDANTAEARATTILHGLGFTRAMMAMKTVTDIKRADEEDASSISDAELIDLLDSGSTGRVTLQAASIIEFK